MDQGNSSESSKVVLQVAQKRERNSEIDMINVFSHMSKRKKLISYLLALSILLGMTIGAFYSGFEHLIGKGSYARAMITFQFEGIEKGLDPKGVAFDVNQLKSPYVIQKALSGVGYDENYIENVRENLVIQGVIPEDALDRITVFNKMGEKDAKYYENLLDISYFPSQYVIYLYDDGTFATRELPQILDGILSSYKQYFLDTYANAQVLSVTANLLSGDDYDYGESISLVRTQIDIMESYVDERATEAPEFRAVSTGLSFEDIKTALEFVDTVDIARLSAFVQNSSLTKDKSRQLEYYDYQIRQISNRISELQSRLETVTKIIANYEKDPVVIVSNADSSVEYGEKNEYYDTLVTQQISISGQIAQANKQLNEYYLLLSKLQESEVSNSQEDYNYADSLLSKINSTIESWVSLIEKTTDEYYSTALYANAVTVTIPAQYFVDGGIMHIVKNMAIPTAILIAIVLMAWFYSGVKTEIVRMRKKEPKNNGYSR